MNVELAMPNPPASGNLVEGVPFQGLNVEVASQTRILGQ
jgi:hypothetical protein